MSMPKPLDIFRPMILENLKGAWVKAQDLLENDPASTILQSLVVVVRSSPIHTSFHPLLVSIDCRLAASIGPTLDQPDLLSDLCPVATTQDWGHSHSFDANVSRWPISTGRSGFSARLALLHLTLRLRYYILASVLDVPGQRKFHPRPGTAFVSVQYNDLHTVISLLGRASCANFSMVYLTRLRRKK